MDDIQVQEYSRLHSIVILAVYETFDGTFYVYDRPWGKKFRLSIPNFIHADDAILIIPEAWPLLGGKVLADTMVPHEYGHGFNSYLRQSAVGFDAFYYIQYLGNKLGHPLITKAILQLDKITSASGHNELDFRLRMYLSRMCRYGAAPEESVLQSSLSQLLSSGEKCRNQLGPFTELEAFLNATTLTWN